MTVRLDVIEIVARDMGESLKFYRLLGLAVPEGVEGDPHVEIRLDNGLRVAWDTLALMQSIHADWVTNPTGCRMKLAFKCDAPAEVDALVETLRAKGYTIRSEPWDAFWGQRYAVVLDPDSNQVDLFADQ